MTNNEVIWNNVNMKLDTNYRMNEKCITCPKVKRYTVLYFIIIEVQFGISHVSNSINLLFLALYDLWKRHSILYNSCLEWKTLL